ncbi:MAG: cation:proton antiporter [Chloroflexota bacterium]
MEAFNAESFVGTLALVGAVIMVAALISGLIERSNFPQVAVFLALGAVLGPAGLGMLRVDLNSPALRVVATLSLALVLFTDALGLNIQETRKQARLALLVLGPGTLLSAGLIALAAWWLLGMPVAYAVILGAALASTDPVLLRGLLRRRDIPSTARQALRLESGLNDVVLLPIVLIAMAFTGSTSASGEIDWGRLFLDLFLLGPGAGVAIGLLGVATLDLVRRRIGIRRDYESIYSLGVAFAAFAAAEAVHGSGFLAAFAAGLTIAVIDVELCDCFLEYGETTAEMLLLFTFVLFGSSLIWSGLGILTGALALFAVLVILIRPVAFLLALVRMRLPRYDRLLISWFGPRGPSTLLLVLLPVFAGVPGSDTLFEICTVVVLLSVVVHGGSLIVIGKKQDRNKGGTTRSAASEAYEPAALTIGGGSNGTGAVEVEQPAASAGQYMQGARPDATVPMVSEPIHFEPQGARDRIHLPGHDGAATIIEGNARTDGEQAGGVALSADRERITLDEVRQLMASRQPVVIVDARTERTYDNSDMVADGAVRIVPEMGDIVDQAKESRLPRNAWVAIFCA